MTAMTEPRPSKMEAKASIGLRGSCRRDPDLWYSVIADDIRHAKSICVTECPVMHLCREYALTTGQAFGVWGGLSEKERRAVLDGAVLPDIEPERGRITYSQAKRYPCPVCGRRLGLNRGGGLMGHEDKRTHTPCTGKGMPPKESS